MQRRTCIANSMTSALVAAAKGGLQFHSHRTSDAVTVTKNLKISRRSGFSSRLRDEMAFRIVCSRGIVSATLPSDPALACLKLSDAHPLLGGFSNGRE